MRWIGYTLLVAVTVLALLGGAAFWRLEYVARLPSPVRLTLTPDRIDAENAHLRELGLQLPAGGVFTQHPFEPPWTSRSLMMPTNWLVEPGIRRWLGATTLRADALRADLDVLEPVMERAYGGWDRAAARGWDWSAWFARWRAQLARGTEEISFDEAFAPVDALLAFERDNHTQIPLARFTASGSETAVLARTPAGPCTAVRAGGTLTPLSPADPGQRVRTARIWRPGASGFDETHYVAMPTSYGVPEAIDCGNAWIPLAPAGKRTGGLLSGMVMQALQETPLDRPGVERLGLGVVYARVPTMAPPVYTNLHSSEWPTRETTDHILVVDLRDNGGGDYGFGMQVLKGWVDPARMVSQERLGFRVTNSCLYPALKWGFQAHFSSIDAAATNPDTRQALQTLVDRIAQPSADGCPRSVTTTRPQWTYQQRRFAPAADALRVVALVNARCGSDCEYLTLLLASLPETLVVGVNTYGIAQFTQPGFSVLPHTGLSYRMALGTSDLYGDDRSVDGYGLDVDVVVPDIDTLTSAEMRDLATAVAAAPPMTPLP